MARDQELARMRQQGKELVPGNQKADQKADREVREAGTIIP